MSESTHLATAIAEAPSPTGLDTVEISSIEPWLHSGRSSQTNFAQYLIWLGMAVSLGLHGLFLVVPFGSEPKEAAPIKPEEKQVRITQLPPKPKSGGVKAVQPKPVPAMNKPASINSTPIPVANPIPKPTESPKPTPQPEAQKTAEQKTVDQKTDLNQVETPDLGPSAWDDFPQYPGSTPGCYGQASCRQTGKDLITVSTFFEKELAGKKYQAQLVKQESERKVYQVSRKGQSQYLNLLVDASGTLYVLAPEVLSLSDLAKAIAVPPEVSEILTGVQAPEATQKSNFAQPGVFFNGETRKPEISTALVLSEPPAEIFPTYIQGNLGTRALVSPNGKPERSVLWV